VRGDSAGLDDPVTQRTRQRVHSGAEVRRSCGVHVVRQ